MRTLVYGLWGIVFAMSLASCERHEPKNTDPVTTAEKHPEPATKPSPSPSSAPASGVVEAPFAAVIPEDAQKKPATGAESTESKGTGPGNGSTAVGGKTQ